MRTNALGCRMRPHSVIRSSSRRGWASGAVEEVVEVKTDTWLSQHALADLLLYLLK